MIPMEHNAVRATPDDLLTLELAYKHDPVIMALIRQVQNVDNMAEELADERASYFDAKLFDDLSAVVEELERVESKKVTKAILKLQIDEVKRILKNIG